MVWTVGPRQAWSPVDPRAPPLLVEQKPPELRESPPPEALLSQGAR